MCTSCENAGKTEPCIYETRGNQSRAEALKEKNTDLELEIQQLRAKLEETGRLAPNRSATEGGSEVRSRWREKQMRA